MAALYPKILFFIAGTTPTAQQVSEANEFGPGVAFRNATLVPPDSPIEQCDGVAGEVPENYAAALPNASDRDAVRKNMARRDPNLAKMYASEFGEPDKAPTETPAERERRINNALARGGKPAPINERNADPSMPEHRTTQSGDPRITYPDSGWQTNPEGLNDAAARGQGIGATEGDTGTVGAAPVGPQGAAPGAPQGLRGAIAPTAPGAPASGAGNPRAPAGTAEAQSAPANGGKGKTK